MFDVSLVELAVIGLVALLVLGPERLPRAARMAGLYLRKARAAWYALRSQFEQELAAEDLRRIGDETAQSLQQVQDRLAGQAGDEARKTQAKSVPASTDPLESGPGDPGQGANPLTPDQTPGQTPGGDASGEMPVHEADPMPPHDWPPEEEPYIPSEPPFGGQDQPFGQDLPAEVETNQDVPASTPASTLLRQD